MRIAGSPYDLLLSSVDVRLMRELGRETEEDSRQWKEGQKERKNMHLAGRVEAHVGWFKG